MKPSLVLLVSFLLCIAATAAELGVLARVGSTDVTVEEIRASLENLDPREQAALARDPALLSQAVRSLLARQIVLKEALVQKWDQNPTVIAQLQRARDNTLIETYLQSVATPPEGWPSEAELRAVYEANQAALLAPRQWRLDQIFVAQPKTADQSAVDRASAKLASIRQALAQPGADFATLARAESDRRAEEPAWVVDSQLRPEIRAHLDGALAGVVSQPLQLDDGWHILKVLEVKEPHTLTLDEVYPLLVRRLRAERAQANRQAYLARFLEQHPVSINEVALSRVLPVPSP